MIDIDKIIAHRGKILWAMFMIIMTITTLSEEKPATDYSFPTPDPNKGEAWGYDFHKQEYRYRSEFQGELPAKVHKVKARTKSTGLKINSLEDIKDIDDLKRLIRDNSSEIYIKQKEFTEDDARDLLDYMND